MGTLGAVGVPESTQTRVFLSYRREEPDTTYAGRVRDTLLSSLGSDSVFQDVHSIPIGSDFREVLRDLVVRSDVVLALIGESWSQDIHLPSDWVRWEISLALELRKPVLPVLLHGSTMPAPDTLPPDISSIAYHNAAPVRTDPDFVGDMSRIVSAIRRLSPAPGALPEIVDDVVEASSGGQVPEPGAGETPAASPRQIARHRGKSRPLSVLVEARPDGSALVLEYVWLSAGSFTTATRTLDRNLVEQFEPDGGRSTTLPAEQFLDAYVIPDDLRQRALDASELHITLNDVADELPWGPNLQKAEAEYQHGSKSRHR